MSLNTVHLHLPMRFLCREESKDKMVPRTGHMMMGKVCPTWAML